MFRVLATRGASAFRGATLQVCNQMTRERLYGRQIKNLLTLKTMFQVRPGQAAPSFRLMSSTQESDAEFDARFLLLSPFSVFQKLYFFLCAGTLPTLTEQTSTDGSSGRSVL